ncbi:MAG TPA: hypothetical protein VMZ53_30560 [Kofleriaceae bacterium]|nr:hypothetical protein [Kofleriaceae bacterium]
MRLPVVCLSIAAAALVIVTPRLVEAGCSIPGFNKAAFGDIGVDIGNGQSDSYNSASGSYASTKCSTATFPNSCLGAVGTNAITNSAVSVGPNGKVNGDCQVGVGGSTATAIGGSGGSSKCGSTSSQSSAITLSSVTAPTWPNGSIGACTGSPTACSVTSAPVTLTANKTYGGVSLSGNATEVLTVSAGDYVFTGNWSIGGNASVKKAGTGTAYIYVTGTSVSIAGNGISNTDASGNIGKPTDLIFMCTDSVTSATVTGGGNGAFAFYCPKADITVNGNGAVYGAIVGKKVTFNGNNAIVHYDAALASLTSSQLACQYETARGAPVIASLTPSYGGSAVDVLVQGSFESPGTKTSISSSGASGTGTVAAFAFPYVKGHVRARLVSTIGATASSITGNTVCTASGVPSGCNTLFDAGANVPAPNATCSTPDGTCRYVFTNLTSSATGRVFHPTKTQLAYNDTNTTRIDSIGALMVPSTAVAGMTTPLRKSLINLVLDSKAGGTTRTIGGVDRSSVAVVGPSSNGAGSASRATIVYWGGLDGMLHAACAQKTTSGLCSASGVTAGTELWAFLPRVQLPYIRTNDQRIDGSIRVMDMYGDFTNDPATGSRSWKTVLIFQTGYAINGTPAVYALDVTDPSTPTILWEVTPPSSLGSTEIGAGLRVVMGAVRVGGRLQNLAVVETRNGGSGGAGVVVKALSVETGAEIWKFSSLYPTTLSPSATGIPGGAVGVDIVGTGEYSDFVFGDLYGRLWMVNSQTGVSRTGATTPLFAFGTNATTKRPIGQPPAIYSNGSSQFAVVSSGAYVDHTDTTGTGLWSSGTQYVVGVKLNQAATSSASESTTACATCAVSFATSFTGFGFAQAIVVGTQLFVTTDSQDANGSSYGATANTGSLRTYALGTTAIAPALSTTTPIAAGATSLAQSGTTLVASGGQKQQKMTSATTTAGNKVDLSAFSKITRMLWLRAE